MKMPLLNAIVLAERMLTEIPYRGQATADATQELKVADAAYTKGDMKTAATHVLKSLELTIGKENAGYQRYEKKLAQYQYEAF